jgi:hypothetical protein
MTQIEHYKKMEARLVADLARFYPPARTTMNAAFCDAQTSLSWMGWNAAQDDES